MQQLLSESSQRVRFRSFSEATLKGYVESREGMDKAGSYGIQELGAALVSEIEIWESRLKNDLPSDYPGGIAKQAVDLTSPDRPGATPIPGKF